MPLDLTQLSQITEPLLAWYEKNARVLPWRENTDAYRVWVSEIMLQQTRVDTVIPYYERFLRRFPDVAALAAAPEQELLKMWEGLGYYSRVRNMQKAAQQICEKYNGIFPNEYEQLLSLPGIGAYTAGAAPDFEEIKGLTPEQFVLFHRHIRRERSLQLHGISLTLPWTETCFAW